jgi:hypothetical protein
VLKKSFSADERNFLGPLIRFARGDVWDRIVSQKRPGTFISALWCLVAIETTKNRLSRDFWRRSIFNFFNTIGAKRTFDDRVLNPLLRAKRPSPLSPSHHLSSSNPSLARGGRSTFALCWAGTHKIELWCGLLDVRYAPIATKFSIAAKCRDVPIGDIMPCDQIEINISGAAA